MNKSEISIRECFQIIESRGENLPPEESIFKANVFN
jgi:hypothetical protein